MHHKMRDYNDGVSYMKWRFWPLKRKNPAQRNSCCAGYSRMRWEQKQAGACRGKTSTGPGLLLWYEEKDSLF